MSSRIRVLHVEDDPDFAALAAEFLERADERLGVTTVHDPTAALDALDDDCFDCVVSDYDLPGMDGVELLEAIRDDHPDLPFVLFTGKGSEEVASEAISAGATDYLQKETGTDQYAILANRVVNAVQQRESRTSYREIFEKAADGIFLHDPETGRVNDVNSRAAEMLGYNRGELAEMEVGDFSADRPEFSQAEAEELVRAAIEDGPQTFEWLFEAKDGEEFWGEVTLKRAVINGDVQVIAMARDVSERKAHERRVREERDRRNALFENRADAIAYVEFEDGAPLVAAVNPAFEETFGYDERDIVGSRIDDVLVPDGADGAGGRDGGVPEASDWAASGDQLDIEVTRETSDGERAFRLRTAPIHPGGGSARGYVVYTDVTERKRREQRLQDQKEKVEALHDVATDIEASSTPEDVYEHVLAAAEEILHYDRGIVDAVRDGNLVPVAIPDGTPEDEYHESTPVDADDSLAARAYRRNESIVVDDLATVDVAPAEPTYQSAITVPIDEYGVFQAVAEDRGVFDETDLDLTELLVKHARETLSRLEHEEELREYAAELERQNERLDEFASVVSHDLRSPLNVAEGRVELAREAHDSDHLDVAADALDRMNQIIQHTLALAREGQAVGDTEPVSLSDAAEESWQVVETGGATLDVAGDTTLDVDPERFRHLLENLFANTVEHAGSDATVRVDPIEDGFYVEDDGPGIPEDERDGVFEPGYTTAEDGTGFGLAIVKEIVNAHRGDVTVTDSDAGGARFEITGLDAD
ncbi:MAG: PAS domain S-box protein [Halobacterium sp.]